MIYYILCKKIRKTRKVSAFPVGFVSNRPVSTPLLDKNGQFIDFYDGWKGDRTFAIDMAGFAFSVKHFIEVNVHFMHIFLRVYNVMRIYNVKHLFRYECR